MGVVFLLEDTVVVLLLDVVALEHLLFVVKDLNDQQTQMTSPRANSVNVRDILSMIVGLDLTRSM